jgi:orotidine-5'-phosphate decarboxylase
MTEKISFNNRLNMLISNKSSFLCIGLDPDIDKIPAHLKYEKNPLNIFTEKIIEATKDLVVAYKANMAFYESESINGLETLQNLCTLIPKDVLLILDGKRGDIENTARKYVKAYFSDMNADAITINPYMGYDSVKPFIQDAQKGVFILALTSNPGANDFQNLQVGKDSLYQYVARKALEWNKNNNCGLVVGATDMEGFEIIRHTTPDLPILVPGIGAQGGDMEKVIQIGRDRAGTGMLINIGRDILYASDGKDFAEKAREKAQYYIKEMTRLVHTSWNYI